MGTDINDVLDNAQQNPGWWDSVVSSFTEQWGFFIVGLCIILGILLLISIFSRGKTIKFKRVVKIGINAIVGFCILFVFNCVATFFNAQIVATWYEWIIIGMAGIPGVILCIVFHFIWPAFW